MKPSLSTSSRTRGRLGVPATINVSPARALAKAIGGILDETAAGDGSFGTGTIILTSQPRGSVSGSDVEVFEAGS